MGGRTHPGNVLGDILLLDSETWTFQQTHQTIPPRFRHTLCAYGTQMAVLFGGLGENGPLNDVWTLSLSENVSCRSIKTDGTTPCPRMSHGACILGDWMYIHGGFADYGTVFDDLYRLHLETFHWEQVVFDSSLPNCFSHCLFALNSTFLGIVGGSGMQSNDRMWVIHPEQKETRVFKIESNWDWVPIRQTAAVLENKLFLMGGGAFCFSFGTIFSSSVSVDLEPLVNIASLKAARKVDIEVLEGPFEMRRGLIVPKRQAKETKDALKFLGWIDSSFKATVLESGNRIAFPVTASCIPFLSDMTRKVSLDKESKTVEEESKISFLREILQSTAVSQDLDFAMIRASAVSPAKRLKLFIQSILNKLEKPDASALAKEIPEKWEKLGDLILLPSNSLISPIWQELFGNQFWEEVARVLDCQRLARQASISPSGLLCLVGSFPPFSFRNTQFSCNDASWKERMGGT